MSTVAWIAAEAARPLEGIASGPISKSRAGLESEVEERTQEGSAVPGDVATGSGKSADEFGDDSWASYEQRRERRIYRARTVAMLRRYMRYSIETGRLPSLVGREFFRSKITKYQVATFEDRVIFVHDMERCLERLDEFSRQLLARHVLQEHDQVATPRLLHCAERTVRRLTPYALDQLSEILLERGLMERLDSNVKISCQGGREGEISVSDCEDSENKF